MIFLVAFQVRVCFTSVLFNINLRLLAFGFLASQEVKDAGVGNLGLWDREFLGSRHDRR